MAFVHGKGTAVTIDGGDLSVYTNNVAFNRSADTHDVTTFGKGSKVYAAGLKDGTGTVSGIYDNTALVSPGAVLRPLVGAAAVQLVYMPEGAGTGKPVATVDVLVTGYEETAPVADMVTWSCSLQFSDDIADTVGV
ncbi:hypothetical protein [Pseudonocardia broussonetiae]|uniref:Phage tail protein n=1 Tax=Pseudonocardia broussonetiae TaxID=2736640 RepID=A0A6M6JYR2_9PSEU|nr:hypothetical protein [Pseudonocardia broussonetiae]QJY51251.1 hypothetical protein HOP40_35310 [Pseudonocardia broussonetiae]